jgi:outer membrane protein assembly factor BamD
MRHLTSSSAFRRRATRALLLLSVAALAGACARGFQPRKITQAPELYRASLREFQRKKFDNALAGLDLLASQLPARDTLLPLVYYHQAQAHARKGEHLLAAQAYQRIGDAFPDDSLADDALLQQAREYQRLWRKPQLDAQYGTTALGTFRQVLSLYPDSPLSKDAGKEIATLNDWFATKDFDNGMHYLRRKAYDPALIYFRDVVRLYPGTPAARRSYFPDGRSVPRDQLSRGAGGGVRGDAALLPGGRAGRARVPRAPIDRFRAGHGDRGGSGRRGGDRAPPAGRGGDPRPRPVDGSDDARARDRPIGAHAVEHPDAVDDAGARKCDAGAAAE